MARASHTSQSGSEGPISGSYGTLSLSLGYTATPGAVASTFVITTPAAFRIDEIEVVNNSSSGGASRPTLVISDGTNNIVTSTITLVTASTQLFTPTSSNALVAAQRTRAKGDTLTFVLTTVASEALVGFNIRVHGHYVGHIVAAAAND